MVSGIAKIHFMFSYIKIGRDERQNDNGIIKGIVRSYIIMVRFVEPHCVYDI